MNQVIQENGGLRRWITAFLGIGLLIVAMLFIVASLFPGDSVFAGLDNAYKWIWQNTTREQFTDIMRDNAWTYAIPAAGIIFGAGYVLRRNYIGRSIFGYVAFGLGLVAGHVFW